MTHLLSSRIWTRSAGSLFLRFLSTHDENSSRWKELKIPVYCGEIAAKEWGPKDGLPIIALHGWQDNACTFDALIPHLLPNLRIVAFDLLGHGLSSHKPRNSLYTLQERLMEVKHVADFMNWKQFSLLGHSMGGAISTVFSCVYPDMVKNLILLDVPHPSIESLKDVSAKTRRAITTYYQYEDKLNKKPPVYSIDEALERFIKGHLGEISEKSGKILMKRASKVSDDGKNVVFTRDIRIQIPEGLPLTTEIAECYMSSIKCNTLIIKAEHTVYPAFNDLKLVEHFKAIFSKQCESFHFEKVAGNHFVHLNNPEIVSPIINSWLECRII